jgi:NAD-dependent deacetylase
VLRPAVGDDLAAALEHVLVAEPRAADVDAACVDPDAIVEVKRPQVPDVRLGRQRLVAVRLKLLVAVTKPSEVGDAGDLEPDEVRSVVRDALGIRLREADGDLCREVEAARGHPRTIACVTAARLAQLIRESQPCVVLTGAGVSTESGIPDFRSPTGIWRDYDPMEYATIDAFRRDPVKVWDFYSKRLDVLQNARPNQAHKALAELERCGLVEAVITQNVDRLHHLAGSREVVEVHGSIRTASCLVCGRREDFERVLELLPVPACASCGAVLKPDVVMFGELLPQVELERASSLVRRAGLVLVIGSSLEVYPVAGLPEEALASGAKLAIVNKGPTPYDRRADLVIDAPAGETLAATVATRPSA